MAQEQPTTNQRGAGGWLSFTALFGDGDRLARGSPTTSGVTPQLPDEDLDDCSDNAEVRGLCEEQELSEMRLDINEIQEAIKNHDLWVQDAVAMRADIEDLQGAVREHEGWMANVTSVMRTIQARDSALHKEVAHLKHQVLLSSAYSNFQAGVRTPKENGVRTPDAPQGAGSEVQPHLELSLASLDLRSLNDAHPATGSVCGGAALERLSTGSTSSVMTVGNGDPAGANNGADTRRMAATLENFVARKLEAERQELRATLDAFRLELAELRPARPDRSPCEVCPAQADGHLAARRPSDGMALDAAAAGGPVRSQLDALEQRMRDKMLDVERTVLEMRAGMDSLRTELSLQAVASGARKLATAAGSEANMQAFRPAHTTGNTVELSQQVRPVTVAARAAPGLDGKQAIAQTSDVTCGRMRGVAGRIASAHDVENAPT
eukprot:TRINITY_DN28273_c0_g1_i1.p1 TRINITY_DN28273_c0_g1~~TRINITY_DN28273_c0_g1_i1.p1  ORF type:complete len:436 (+),score=77.98 TRINITY_DN28273_c0_g1_i1:162-1469(+)